MIMEIGNIYYFLSLALLIICPTVLYLFVKNKYEDDIKLILVLIAFGNFLLHFLTILHPSYLANMNYSFIRLSLENICGVTTVFLPFVMLSKNKTLKGYFYMMAFIGGLMAVIKTTDPVGAPITEFNTIRYYICHYILFSIPIVAVLTGEYNPRVSSSIFMPILFLGGQTIIFLNEVVLIALGLVKYTPEMFFSADWRNAAFVFGPTSEYQWIVDKFSFLVPEIFRTNIFGVEGLTNIYWPVVWAIIPALILFPILYFLLAIPFSGRDPEDD